MRELRNCPYCDTEQDILKIGRDWWRISNEHKEHCYLDGSYPPDYSQTDEQRIYLIDDWNDRVCEKEAIKKVISDISDRLIEELNIKKDSQVYDAMIIKKVLKTINDYKIEKNL